MERTRRPTLGILTFICYILTIVSSEDVCQPQCQGPIGNQNLLYQSELTYRYNFSSVVNITLPNTHDFSKVAVRATVLLSPQTECSYVLRLRNVQITGPNFQTYKNLDGVEKPVTFSYQHGAIGNSICTDSSDSQFSLNIKRGIISLFQVDTREKRQTDVFGVCPIASTEHTHYDRTIIRKWRKLNQCKNGRENIIVGVLKGLIESNPVLQSNVITVQSLNDGLIRQVNVDEHYSYLALGTQEGAQVAVKSELKFLDASREPTIVFRPTVSKSIIFDQTALPTETKSTKEAVVNALHSLSRDNTAVGEYSGRGYLNLIKIMRDSHKDELIALFRQIKGELRDSYVWALLRCGTGSSLAALMELAQNKELTPTEEKQAYVSLADVKHATSDVLDIVARVLNSNAQLSGDAYLAIGSLVKSYCDENVCNGGVTYDIVMSIARKLGSSQNSDVIYALKALANARQPNEATSRRIITLAQNAPMRIRAAALTALLTDPCRETTRNGALHILLNAEEDSELRIRAYLILAQCPTFETTREVERLLNEESSYQVGSFITSHLKSCTNAFATIRVHKKFPQDPRRYSFNAAYDDDATQTSSRASVVYSQTEFMPRFVNLNVTAEMLGADVNLMEVELRQENLARLAEHYFGPKGVSPNHFLSKRDLNSRDIRKLTQRIHSNETSDEIVFDLSVKLFGNEWLYLNADFGSSPDGVVNKVLRPFKRDLIGELVQHGQAQTNAILLDSLFTVPTSLGLPLRLGIEAISSLQFKLEAQRFEEYRYKWNIVPSANVEIATSITLDAHVVESGVKVLSNIHAAVGVDLDIKRNPFVGDEAKLTFPVKQQQLSASHDVVFSVREPGQVDTLKPIKFHQNEETIDCFKRIEVYAGINACMKLNSPPPSSPNKYLAGNYKIALSLNNTDFSHFELYQRRARDPSTYEVGAKIVDKKHNITKTGMAVTVTIGQEMIATCNFVVPKNNLTIEGRLTNTKTEKSASFAIVHNNILTAGKVGVGLEETLHKETYTPLLYLSKPTTFGQHYLIATKGSVHVEHKKIHEKKITFDNLQLILDMRNIYSVQGDLGADKHGYHADLALSDGFTTIKLHERLRQAKNKMKFIGFVKNNRYPDFNLHVDYHFLQHPMGVESVLEVAHGRDGKTANNRLTVKNVLGFNEGYYEVRSNNTITYPAANFKTQADYVETSNRTLTIFDFGYNSLVYGAKLDARYNQKERGDYDVNVSVHDANNRIAAAIKRDVYGSLSVFNNTLAINRALYELSGRLALERSSYAALLIKAPELESPVSVDLRINRNGPEENWILLVKDDRNKYVDFMTTIVWTSINIKIQAHILHVLDVDSHLTHSRTGGNAELTIDLYRGRIIKTEINYVIDSKLITAKLTYHPDLRKHPGRSVSIGTDTQIGGTIMNSVNTIYVDGIMFHQLTLKYSEQRFDYNQEHAAELEYLTKRGDFATIKCKHSFIRIDMYTQRTTYTVDIQEKLLNWYRDKNTLNVNVDFKHTMAQEDANMLTISSDSFYIGRFKLNLTDVDRYQNYTVVPSSRNIIFKLFDQTERDGVYIRAATNTVYKKKWNYIFDATALDGAEQLFINGTYYNDGSEERPIEVNITSEMRNDLFQKIKNFKFNCSTAVFPQRYKRNYLIIKTDARLKWNENQDFPSNSITTRADARLGRRDGQLSISVHDLYPETMTAFADYGYVQNQTSQTKFANFKINVADRRIVTTHASKEITREGECFINAHAKLPHTDPIWLQIKLQQLRNSRERFVADVHLTAVNRTYKVNTIIEAVFTNTPNINLKITYPDQTTDQILAGIDFRQPRVMKSNLKVNLNSVQFLLDGKLEVETIENVTLEIRADCPHLKLSKFIANIDMKNPLNYANFDNWEFRTGNQLKIFASNAGKKLITTSVNCTIHRKIGTHTYNCSSAINIIYDRPRTYGFEYTDDAHYNNTFYFNVNVDNNNFGSKFQLKKGDIRIDGTFCDSARPCIKMVAMHKYNSSSTETNVTESLYIDLRYFGWHELEIKEMYGRANEVVNITTDLIFNNRNRYGHTLLLNEDAFELSLHTPQRIIALDGRVKTDWGQPKTMRVNFYANKMREPHHKSSLTGFYDCRGTPNVGKCNMELRFTDPYLPKDLVLSYDVNHNQQQIQQRLVFDVFNNEDDAIVMLYKSTESEEPASISILQEIKSKGLNFHLKYHEGGSVQLGSRPEFDYYYNVKLHISDISYDNEIVTRINPEEFLFRVKLFNENILKLHRRHRPTLTDTTIHLIGLPSIESRAEIKNLNLLNITVSSKEYPGEKLQLTMKVFGGEIAHFKLERYRKSTPILLSNISLSVTDGKILYDYRYDAQSIESNVLIPIKQAIDNTKEKIRKIVKYGKMELGHRRDVLIADMTEKLPHFIATDIYYGQQFDNLEQELNHEPGMRDILTNTATIWNPIANVIEATAKSTIELAYLSAIAPFYLYEDFDKQIQVFLFDDVEEFLYNMIIQVNNEFGRYEHDMKNTGVVVANAFGDVVLVVDIAKGTALYYYKMFKRSIFFEKMSEGAPAPEGFIRNYKRLANELKQLTNSDVVHRFIDLVADYTEKKLRREAIDDDVAIQELMDALEEVLKFIYHSDDGANSWMALYTIYQIAIIEIQPTTFLLEHNHFNSHDLEILIKDEMNKIKFPVDFNGVITQNHIFTFDGKHVSFKGDCDYLLVHDIVDRNFSLAASYSGGLLNSITYEEKDDTITIHKDGIVPNKDMPIINRNIEVLREYKSVTIFSKNGITIRCDLELTCSIRISGYYHARLRGLLGNANHEAYDDSTLPNGEIAISDEEYVNSYKLNSKCADVRIQTAPNNPQCTDLMLEPNFENCFGYVNANEYKSACDEGMQMGIPNTERVIANAYVSQCNKQGTHIKVPDWLVKCADYEKTVNQSFEVDLPGNSADIVIVFEEKSLRYYGETLQKLLEETTQNFQAKKINDIQFHMIGYGSDKKPHHYTSNGNLTFNEVPELFKMNLRANTQQSNESYQEMLMGAYREALLYPFRSHAVKSVIIFNDKPCIVSTLARAQKSLPFVVDEHIAVYYLTGHSVEHNYHLNLVSPSLVEYDKVNSRNCDNYLSKRNGMVFAVPQQNEPWYTNKVSQTITRKVTEGKWRLYCECRMISTHEAQNVCETLYVKSYLY